MTRRSMGSMAAALMVAAGLSNVAWSDNTGQPVPAGPNSGAAAGAGAKQPGLAPAGSESGWNWRAEAFGGYKSDTKPSRDSIMQFSASSEVREILTPGGSRVKKGDVLIRARDTEIIAALTQQRIRAGNELEIKGAEEQAKLADAKLKALQKSTVFSEVEYWEAETAARVSVIQLDLAKWNKQQEELRVKQLEAQAERFRLEAPFDGIVEEVMVEVGQGVTEQDKVLRLVNVEKIWLDPYADTNETIRLGLKEGSPAWVLLDLPEPKMARGRVVYVSPVAESVSQTRRVRVEIENPLGWPAGTQARVRFTEPGGEWEKYKAASGLSVQPLRDESNLGVSSGPRVISLRQDLSAFLQDPDTVALAESDLRAMQVFPDEHSAIAFVQTLMGESGRFPERWYPTGWRHRLQHSFIVGEMQQIGSRSSFPSTSLDPSSIKPALNREPWRMEMVQYRKELPFWTMFVSESIHNYDSEYDYAYAGRKEVIR